MNVHNATLAGQGVADQRRDFGRTVRVHLTPEQIDRQPFRMRKRGYDIMQVRNFLREIAQEMRSRQRVRDELAADGNPEAVAAVRATELIAEAEERAAEIVDAAHHRVELVGSAEEQAAQIVDNAVKEAARRLDDAEDNARARGDEVMSETQTRLDALLAQEREVHQRLHELELDSTMAAASPLPMRSGTDSTAMAVAPEFADFATSLQSAVRDEISG
ncbi:MAG: DivIVA domain-containing protein [Acidimicrobiales bacterium]|nr:DivIVA domain-containing protein [Acidimicrobiales bacterium]RZV45456.1 MAG: DivIVA domain-containing protein [Acidimicrobiales bacterium]